MHFISTALDAAICDWIMNTTTAYSARTIAPTQINVARREKTTAYRARTIAPTQNNVARREKTCTRRELTTRTK